MSRIVHGSRNATKKSEEDFERISRYRKLSVRIEEALVSRAERRRCLVQWCFLLQLTAEDLSSDIVARRVHLG
ncbi:hypothetical protein NA56DRAFT_652130 [Hyaloscypha hepaticicola]|uniref:Uncharacterized protein n=1 Tax=Hyaloscypha hepaticicola TaxID=2082293 RepID=A0A2J6PG16_9HELO|nr:hypothetical protein NA56DRAFT_652130 [Hyaloscypha hepaticicola]